MIESDLFRTLCIQQFNVFANEQLNKWGQVNIAVHRFKKRILPNYIELTT